MDAKITKKRLGHMLSYDWVSIIIGAVVAIVVWSLVFTMTATRITPAQQFTVYNYLGNLSFMYTDFYEVYNGAYTDGKFSAEVLELEDFDLPSQEEVASTLLEGHLGTNNGDLIFAANIFDESTDAYKDPVTEEEKHYTYLEEFLRGYHYHLFNLDTEAENGFFKRMENYLNAYFDDGYENGTLNKAKAEADFRARIKANKDKRYKKEAQILVGIEQDYERLEKYRDALVEFYGYLDAGYVRVEKTQVRDVQDPSKITVEGYFTLNLCPATDASGNENPMKKLSKTLSYATTYVDEQGEEQPTTSAIDMHVGIFNMDGVESGYEYEGLLFINELIRTALAAA